MTNVINNNINNNMTNKITNNNIFQIINNINRST